MTESKWRTGYIHGPRAIIEQWELDSWPHKKRHDEDGNLVPHPGRRGRRLHSAYRSNLVYPLIQDGVNEAGNPVYIPDPSRDDVLVLYGALNDEMKHIRALDNIEGVTAYKRKDRNQIRALLPDFAVGQGTPHFT